MFYSLKGRVSKNLWRDCNTTKGVVNKSSEHKTLWYDDAKTSQNAGFHLKSNHNIIVFNYRVIITFQAWF